MIHKCVATLHREQLHGQLQWLNGARFACVSTGLFLKMQAILYSYFTLEGKLKIVSGAF